MVKTVSFCVSIKYCFLEMVMHWVYASKYGNCYLQDGVSVEIANKLNAKALLMEFQTYTKDSFVSFNSGLGCNIVP